MSTKTYLKRFGKYQDQENDPQAVTFVIIFFFSLIGSYLLKAEERGIPLDLSSDGIGRDIWIVGLDLHNKGELLCHVQRTTKLLKAPNFHAAALNVCVLEKSLN